VEIIVKLKSRRGLETGRGIFTEGLNNSGFVIPAKAGILKLKA
jgi:hypothetical protein